MTDLHDEILDVVTTVARCLHAEHAGIGPCTEDAEYRPAVVNELQDRGFRTGEIRLLRTTARAHPFDIVWERNEVRGAIELKLPTRTSPVDDARLFFRYDIRWLELGIAAGHFTQGTAVMLTDLRGLYEESGRGDWRHDYYRIGHRSVHRCVKDGPDHFFDRQYPPGTQFLKELFPLRLEGCYDFRSLWSVIGDGSSSLYQLVVPVRGGAAA